MSDFKCPFWVAHQLSAWYAKILLYAKLFTYEVDPAVGSTPDPIFPAKKSKLSGRAAEVAAQAERDLVQREQQYEDHLDATRFTQEQTTAQRAALHEIIDKHLQQQAINWGPLLSAHNTDGYLDLFSWAIENAVTEYGQLN